VFAYRNYNGPKVAVVG